MILTWLRRATVGLGIPAAVLVSTSQAAHAADASCVLYNRGQIVGEMEHFDNGDKFWITDWRADGHGVRGWLLIETNNGLTEVARTKYNGYGNGGGPVTFTYDIKTGKVYHMKVCLVDGASDSTPGPCAQRAILE